MKTIASEVNDILSETNLKRTWGKNLKFDCANITAYRQGSCCESEVGEEVELEACDADSSEEDYRKETPYKARKHHHAHW